MEGHQSGWTEKVVFIPISFRFCILYHIICQGVYYLHTLSIILKGWPFLPWSIYIMSKSRTFSKLPGPGAAKGASCLAWLCLVLGSFLCLGFCLGFLLCLLHLVILCHGVAIIGITITRTSRHFESQHQPLFVAIVIDHRQSDFVGATQNLFTLVRCSDTPFQKENESWFPHSEPLQFSLPFRITFLSCLYKYYTNLFGFVNPFWKTFWKIWHGSVCITRPGKVIHFWMTLSFTQELHSSKWHIAQWNYFVATIHHHNWSTTQNLDSFLFHPITCLPKLPESEYIPKRIITISHCELLRCHSEINLFPSLLDKPMLFRYAWGINWPALRSLITLIDCNLLLNKEGTR